ncbi:MAG: fibronectin type III domain-containing protein [Acidimicrobiales bacterium]
MQPTRPTSPGRRRSGVLVVSLVLVAAATTACSQTPPPAAPTGLLAVSGNGAASVSWQAPAQGAAVTSYVVSTTPTAGHCTSTKTSCTVNGLANGHHYRISVQSVGAGGTSSPTSMSLTIGVPWSPGGVTATAGDTSATVAWTAPAFSPGAPVSSYVVTSDPGGRQCVSSTTSCTVTGLVNGTPYAFAVVARNLFGQSALASSGSPVTPSTDAGGSAGIVYLGPVDASQETTGGTVLQRDAGISVALPNGRDLWIFGDTSSFSADASQSSAFIGGSTAAKGKYRRGVTPGVLQDVQPAGSSPDSTKPSQFIPTPTDTYMPNGSGKVCTPANGAVYTARWPTGAVLLDNPEYVLVTYSDVCVTSVSSFTVEGWGFMIYQWKSDKIRYGPDDVFAPSTQGTPLPADRTYQSPVVANSKITLFTSTCTSLFIACGSGTVSATTIADTLPALIAPTSYVSQPVATDGATQWMPVNVTVATYPTGLRLIEQTSIGGTFTVYSSSSPTGPWHAFLKGTLPGCSTTPTGFCYAFVGHPELGSTTSLIVSYFKPDSPQSANIGHVDLALVPVSAY